MCSALWFLTGGRFFCAFRQVRHERSLKSMTINAEIETFDLIEAAGKAVLFTPFRIERNTVPDDLYCYDLRASDHEDGESATIENTAVFKHMGTILCREPFDLEDDGRLPLKDALSFLSSSALSLDDYRRLPGFVL